MTVQAALNKTEARVTTEVRRGYRQLRAHTDPRGHDLLAALEQEHLSQIEQKYEYARRMVGIEPVRLRLLKEDQ